MGRKRFAQLRIILKLVIGENKNTLVTYDEVAQSLWEARVVAGSCDKLLLTKEIPSE